MSGTLFYVYGYLNSDDLLEASIRCSRTTLWLLKSVKMPFKCVNRNMCTISVS